MSALRPTAVLVVDDDANHAWIARLVLDALAPGLPVEVCIDAAAAREAIGGLPRGALVLMDRRLGGVETFDTVVDCRSRRPDVPVVMLSAMFTSIDRAYAIACGARDAIEKPSTLAEWRSVLGVLIAADAPAPRVSRAA